MQVVLFMVLYCAVQVYCLYREKVAHLYRFTGGLLACYQVANNPFEQSLSLLYILDSCGPGLTVTYEALLSFCVCERYLVSLPSVPGQHTGGMLENLPSKDAASHIPAAST